MSVELNAAQVLDALGRIPVPAERAQEAGRIFQQVLALQQAVKELRREAVMMMVDSGMTYEEIAQELGVNRARAFQIGKGYSGATAKYYKG